MDKTEYTWHKIADNISELSLSERGLAELDLDGKKICISMYKENLYACIAKCPHASGPLADGHIDPLGNIVCPVHRYKFSLQNGRNSSGEGYFLKTYPVEQRGDGIFIGIRKSGLFSWLK